jgi:hypothetical protein
MLSSVGVAAAQYLTRRRQNTDPIDPVALLPHFVHDVVLADVPDHLEAEIGIRPHFGRRRMIDLNGLDLLAEIGGVSAYMITSPTRSVLDSSRRVATDRWL